MKKLLPDRTIGRFVSLAAAALCICGCGSDDDVNGPSDSEIELFVNELLASNDTGLTDPDFGETGDWIEIHNGGTSAVDMGGMFLTDDIATPDKWEFPSGTILAGGGYLVVWADDGDTSGVALHANFKLSADGEDTGLFTASLDQIDAVTFPAQTTDISYGRTVDGGGSFTTFADPTPGSDNSGPPANRPPFVASVAITPALPGPADTVRVAAFVSDDDSVASVLLVCDAGAGPDTLAMTTGDGLSFTTPIDPAEEGTDVAYYVIAIDGDGESALYPADAPATTLSYTVGAAAAPVFINEFLAKNDSTNRDPDFDVYADWLELYNAGAAAVDLSGWTLTDDLAEPDQWTFPAGTTIAGGGFLLVWADDANTEISALHTNFKLKAGGEGLGLFNTQQAPVDSLTFGEQTADISYGRTADGGGEWDFFSAPTPGASNE